MHHPHAIPQSLYFAHAQGLQGTPVVLLAAIESAACRFVDRTQQGKLPLRDRAQNQDPVFIRHEHRRFDGGPRFFQLLQADLDHRHTEQAFPVLQRRGQVVTRFAVRRTDTEKAPVTGRFGIPEVRPEGEILADEAVAAPEIAGREHEPTVVHDVNGQGTGPGVEAFEVLVDLAHETGIPRAVQQIDHIALKPEGGREIGVLADLALQACGV